MNPELEERGGERRFPVVVFDDRSEKLQGDIGLEGSVSAPTAREQSVVFAFARLEPWPGWQYVIGSESPRRCALSVYLFPDMKRSLSKKTFLVSSHFHLPWPECAADVVHEITRANSPQRNSLLDPRQRIQSGPILRRNAVFRHQRDLGQITEGSLPGAGRNSTGRHSWCLRSVP